MKKRIKLTINSFMLITALLLPSFFHGAVTLEPTSPTRSLSLPTKASQPNIMCEPDIIYEINDIREMLACIKPGSLVVFDMDETLIGHEIEELDEKSTHYKKLINESTLQILREMNTKGAHIIILSHASLGNILNRMRAIKTHDKNNSEMLFEFKAFISSRDKKGRIEELPREYSGETSYAGETKADIILDYIKQSGLTPTNILFVDDTTIKLNEALEREALFENTLIAFRFAAWDKVKAFESIAKNLVKQHPNTLTRQEALSKTWNLLKKLPERTKNGGSVPDYAIDYAKKEYQWQP